MDAWITCAQFASISAWVRAEPLVVAPVTVADLTVRVIYSSMRLLKILMVPVALVGFVLLFALSLVSIAISAVFGVKPEID